MKIVTACPSVRALNTAIAFVFAIARAATSAQAEPFNQVAGDLVTLNTNGAWSWYMDERVIIDAAAGKLLASSVANANGTGGEPRHGDIDVISYDLAANQLDAGAAPLVLHDNLQGDDHNGAALLVRPDGRYLAVYTKHNQDKLSLYRVSTNPHDATSWQPEQAFNWAATPGSDFNATYSNLFYLAAENRTYNFARTNNRSPNMMLSDDCGDTWTYGGRLLATPTNVGYVNGYLKYAQNGDDRIDFIATEHHPRDFNNNIYHGYITGGKMYRSDGSLLDADIFDNVAPAPTALTKVFASDPENGSQEFSRAWTTDLHIDAQGHPYAIFTTRANDIPVNTNGYNDHRFFYARYDGSQWNVHHLAKAGARLYGSEQDYTGLVALDPHDPNRLYISTTIDPRDGADLENHEIFAGVTGDGGATWRWNPVTFNSKVDNLRPTIPINPSSDDTTLVWMRGTYRSMFDYDLDIVALTEFGPLAGPSANAASPNESAHAIHPVPAQSRPLRVAIYEGPGSQDSGIRDVERGVKLLKGATIERLPAKAFGERDLSEFDVIVFSAGAASTQANDIGDQGRHRVRQFVEGGGAYLGICAGAYLACAEFDWGLKLIAAETISDRWQRGVGNVQMQLTADGRNAFGHADAPLTVAYENGPVIGPIKVDRLPPYRSLATFTTELAENDSPPGIMTGSPAIAEATLGKGRVMIFSPHPERTKGLERFVPLALVRLTTERAEGEK